MNFKPFWFVAMLAAAAIGGLASADTLIQPAAAETVAECRDTAYGNCKDRECKARSQYCTGQPADIEASPCYVQQVESCAPQKASRCRRTAYGTCKDRECGQRSQYCTGKSADLEASPCYGEEFATCMRN